MGVMDEADRIAPGSLGAWSAWLAERHADVRGVWLEVPDRVAPGEDALSYENAVCEALCWGWIDGQARSGGTDGGSVIWFAPRRKGSPWAASNRVRVARLTEAGRMRPAGQALVDGAHADGSWTVLVGPENGEEPDALPRSARLFALTQVATAKREDTRLARIERLVAQCVAGERPDR